MSAPEQARAEKVVEDRVARRIPAAYILGEAWLGGHRFFIDERVIVPRSFIAELLKARLQPWVVQRSVSDCLDLCTGSGCLAVLAAKAFPKALVHAVDISKAALQVAKINIAKANLEKRVQILQSDLFSHIRKGRRYGLIISNPPYVKSREMNRLPPEYRQEPAIALAGGADGLAVVRRIVHEARRYLTDDGALVLEIGRNRRALERAFPRIPFTWVHTSGGPDMVVLLKASELPA